VSGSGTAQLRPELQAAIRRISLSLVAMGGVARHAGTVAEPVAAVAPLLEAIGDILGLPPGDPTRIVALLLRRGDTHHVVVAHGLAPGPVPADAVPARLATDAVPLLYEDLREPADFAPWPNSPAPGAAMFAPLSWNGCYFGCIYCCSVRPHTYTADDVSVLGGFADLASLVWIARAGPR
jgi:hypothetical protein